MPVDDPSYIPRRFNQLLKTEGSLPQDVKDIASGQYRPLVKFNVHKFADASYKTSKQIQELAILANRSGDWGKVLSASEKIYNVIDADYEDLKKRKGE